jgi:hypothetical protein
LQRLTVRRKDRGFVVHPYGETFSIIRASRNDLQDALAEGDEYKTRKESGRWLRKAMECVLCMSTARRQPVHGGKINNKIIRSN